MIVRQAEAHWQGDLRQGKGRVKVGSGAFEGPYSFQSRFESAPQTNPEELLGAAHAGCFTMALSLGLSQKGFTPTNLSTTAKVRLEQQGQAFAITRIDLETTAEVPGIDDATFQQIAEETKAGCPVSKVLTGTQIHLTAVLK